MSGPATTSTPPTAARPQRPVLANPLVPAVLYVAAWIAGLSAWPSNLSIAAPPGLVLATYRGATTPASVQYLLVEGLAGLLLGWTAVAVAHRVAGRQRRALAGRAAGVALGSGLLAAAVSVAQCVIGLQLVAAARHDDRSRAGTLFELVNRLDGGKMLLLALAAACLVVAGRGRLGRWLIALCVLAAVSLAASGVDYLLLAGGGAWLVYVSGPALLLWVVAVAWRAVPGDGARKGLPEQA